MTDAELDALLAELDKGFVAGYSEAAAALRQVRQEREGLIARFHAECCETECKCHCDELRRALASSAPETPPGSAP